MRIDMDEGTGRAAEEVETIDRGGSWWTVFRSPQDVIPGEPHWLAHGAPDKESAELVAESMARKYPDRPYWAVGFGPGEMRAPPRVVAFLPDGIDVAAVGEDTTRQAIEAVIPQMEYMTRRARRDRAAFVAAESATVPPPLPSGPDFNDHLYRNKSQVGPDAVRHRDDGGCTCGADRTGPSAEAHDPTCPAAGPGVVKGGGE